MRLRPSYTTVIYFPICNVSSWYYQPQSTICHFHSIEIYPLDWLHCPYAVGILTLLDRVTPVEKENPAITNTSKDLKDSLCSSEAVTLRHAKRRFSCHSYLTSRTQAICRRKQSLTTIYKKTNDSLNCLITRRSVWSTSSFSTRLDHPRTDACSSSFLTKKFLY